MYITGQIMPVVQKIINPSTINGITTFSAKFPFTNNTRDGLTIAAVTNSTGPFNANDVAKKPLFGPWVDLPQLVSHRSRTLSAQIVKDG